MENILNNLDNELLEILLIDRTTNKNIIWATDNYSIYGVGYQCKDYITIETLIKEYEIIIRPRAKRSSEEQSNRTRNMAEVSTPIWICNKQNNLIDNRWFGVDNLFNTEVDDTWITNTTHINFPTTSGKTWQDYINDVRLEITCGEAPYLVSRYDSISGCNTELSQRIGLLDRKLRVVSENTYTETEWIKWAIKSYQNTYGYDWQGDNVLLARINLFFTFIDYYMAKFNKEPTIDTLKEIAKIISWNIWQMDGLNCVVPYSDICCIIKNWNTNKNELFVNFINDTDTKDTTLHFDVVVGNPPYQQNISKSEGNKSLSKQLYPKFIMIALKISSKYVSLITPSRWFTGDAQDRSFIKLRDELATNNNNHFYQIHNFGDSSNIFIGVALGAVNYFLYDKSYEGDCQFYNDLNKTPSIRPLFETGVDVIIALNSTVSIVKKVISHSSFTSLMSLTKGRNAFGITGAQEKSISSTEYFDGAYKIRCAHDTIKYVKEDYISKNKDIADSWKVFISKSNGAAGLLSDGKCVSIIGTAYVGDNRSVCTDSLIPIGKFDNKIEANNLHKYMSTKFLRFMVGIMKVSQNLHQNVYKFVPVQNFTDNSDINWNMSIENIDQQLYNKYKLTSEEIDYIESKLTIK